VELNNIATPATALENIPGAGKFQSNLYSGLSIMGHWRRLMKIVLSLLPTALSAGTLFELRDELLPRDMEVAPQEIDLRPWEGGDTSTFNCEAEKSPGVWRTLDVSQFFHRRFPVFPGVTDWQGDLLFRSINVVLEEHVGMGSISLSDIIPMHGFHNPQDVRGKIFGIMNAMLLTLTAGGYLSGEPPSEGILIELLKERDQYDRLPKVSQPIAEGKRLLLNGHHRLVALILLVKQGYLPHKTLQSIPVDIYELELEELLKPLQHAYAQRSDAFRFSWVDLFSFDDDAAALVQSLGATQTLRDVLHDRLNLQALRRLIGR